MAVGVAVLTFIAGLQAAPQLAGPRECLDDNGLNRCLPEVQARVRDKLGVASIDEEAEAGAEVYRAFFVDGYGQDMPAVAFERRRGQAPKAVVYGQDGRRIEAPVSAQVWNRVRMESIHADRRLEPIETASRADGMPSPPQLCLHSWVQTVEMANTSPSRFGVETVRRRTEDACERGLATRFAFFLAEEAVQAIPPCDVLDKAQQRNRITQLASCFWLEGDRLTAAELRNARERIGPRPGLDQNDPRAWRAALGTNGSPVLTWGGETVRTERGRDNRVAEFIVARLADHPGLHFNQQRFEGVSGREGVVLGQAQYRDGDVAMVAPYRQVWVWDPNLNDWMLSEWVLQPFSPVS